MAVSLGALLLPIVLSAVFVFIASSIIHMVLKYHRTDYQKLPQEEAARQALRQVPPGQYMFPYCSDMAQMKSPEMLAKWREGPVGLMYLRAPGDPKMGGSLVQWFILCLVISVFCAYIGAVTLPAGTNYLTVFRVVGSAGLLGYAGQAASGSIWLGKPWAVTFKEWFDGLVYALLTAGTFGWLWPK